MRELLDVNAFFISTPSITKKYFNDEGLSKYKISQPT